MALAALICFVVAIGVVAIMSLHRLCGQHNDYSFGLEYLFPSGIALCCIGLAVIFGIIAFVQKAL